MPRDSTIQIRRSPRATSGDVPGWETVNPVLAVGELGLNIETKELKVGTNYTAWNSLPAFTAGSLNPALPTSLGGTNNTSPSYSGPLSMVSSAADYDLTGVAGTTGFMFFINCGTGSGGGTGQTTFTVASPPTGVLAGMQVAATNVVSFSKVVSTTATTVTVDTPFTGSVSGTVQIFDQVDVFGRSVTLLPNMTYLLEACIEYSWTPSATGNQPAVYFKPTNGITFQASGFNAFIQMSNQTATDTSANGSSKYERWNVGAGLAGLTVSGAGLTATNQKLRLQLTGVVRTITGGTLTMGIRSSNSATAAKVRAGSFMKFTQIGTPGGSADSIGTWV